MCWLLVWCRRWQLLQREVAAILVRQLPCLRLPPPAAPGLQNVAWLLRRRRCHQSCWVSAAGTGWQPPAVQHGRRQQRPASAFRAQHAAGEGMLTHGTLRLRPVAGRRRRAGLLLWLGQQGCQARCRRTSAAAVQAAAAATLLLLGHGMVVQARPAGAEGSGRCILSRHSDKVPSGGFGRPRHHKLCSCQPLPSRLCCHSYCRNSCRLRLVNTVSHVQPSRRQRLGRTGAWAAQ